MTLQLVLLLALYAIFSGLGAVEFVIVGVLVLVGVDVRIAA